jgi:hypothetical protein
VNTALDLLLQASTCSGQLPVRSTVGGASTETDT